MNLAFDPELELKNPRPSAGFIPPRWFPQLAVAPNSQMSVRKPNFCT